MEQLNAFGVACIEYIQYWFQDFDAYLELINDVSNPHHLTEMLFPALSIIDSVFAAQLLLCLSFGGWLNTVMKWWFFEDRPYWWVRESTYYPEASRPRLQQSHQTCETGPGSPSGHSSAAAIALTLAVMFAAHVASDRKWRIPSWVTSIAYPTIAWLLGSVMLARMYVAAHFPHQCLLGALVGLFITPVLCLYVSDPYIWRYGYHSQYPYREAMRWHCVCAVLTAAIAALTYVAVLATKDPMQTVQLAFRSCDNPNCIRVSTTPMVLAESTGYLLGWAVSVTPAVAKYRHNTPNRSLLISVFCTALTLYTYHQIDENLCKSNTFRYYLSKFLMFAVKPMILLRVVPAVSMWPFIYDAFRWCEYPESIRVTTTPMFALVQSTGYLLGWAAAVTPAVAKYRHNTPNRSLLISAFCTALTLYTYQQIDENLCKSNTLTYYLSKFLMFAVKPMILLRVVPAASMWPFSSDVKLKKA